MKPERIITAADTAARSDVPENGQKNHDTLSTDELTALRTLLVGPEQQQLRVLQQQVDGFTVHAEAVGRVLPEAILLRLRQDHQLPQVLTPLVEAALQDSIKNTPRLWIDSLFPVIGPAIRRAIAHTLRSMLTSLNQTLEQSLSLRSFQWRLEAWRTGKSFSEVLILRTLRYRVEQVFLIHNRTGLLLHHVVAPAVAVPEGELIAGMLTAIQDFVHDSFGATKDQGLETVQIGDLMVWVERGAQATLAAVIRGSAPEELREVFQDALDGIHLEYGAALAAFQGETTPFSASQERLEYCLQMQLEAQARQSSFLVWKLAGVVLLVAVGVWLFLIMRENRRWDHYLARLRATPGIVVTTAEKRAGKFFVAGLRDPLAADPLTFLNETRLNQELIVRKWEPYHALHPDFVLARAKTILAPTATVTLQLVGEILTAAGSASHQWIEDSCKIARAIPGVSALNTDGVIDADEILLKELAASKARIEKSILYFIVNTTELIADQKEMITQLTEEIPHFFGLARQLGQGFRLEVSGHTDTTGLLEKNTKLGQQRAEFIISLLIARGVTKDALTLAIAKPRPHEELTERDRELNRCVMFHVEPIAVVRTGQ